MSANAINIVYRIYKFYHKVYQYKNYLLAGSFVLLYLILYYTFLQDYFITDFVVWLALLSVPFVLSPDKEKKGNVRYFVLSLIFAVLSLYAGLQTFYFFALGFALLFAIDSFIGNTGALSFFLLGLLSPVFKYLNNLFGFPIRLKLSEWSGDLLALMGHNVNVRGNVLELNGAEFSVDPACVGLKMMAVSLLGAILIIAFFQQRIQQKFSFKSVLAILLLVAVFNIVANLIRILLLTSFKILPDNPNHDIVGVLCLIVYVMLPTYIMVKFIVKRVIKADGEKTYKIWSLKRFFFLNVFLLTSILFVCFFKLNNPSHSNVIVPEINLKGFSKTIVEGDILKFEKNGLLVYVKPMNHFYGAEHNPMICWVGSGYEFNHINTLKVNNKEIYTGILTKGTETLYSAWWFESETSQTISQVDWRLRTLNGETFYLVNINAESEMILKKEIQQLIKK